MEQTTVITSLKYTTPVIKKDQPDDSHKFQSPPGASGNYPYHLNIDDVVPGINKDKMVFHMVGDTGSIRNPGSQRHIAALMAGQYGAVADADKPQFLYHLGDVVYNHGEAKNYYDQFYEPYSVYPGPILAIAGNHDSDVNPAAEFPYQSLDAFTTVFCDTVSRPVAFSREIDRMSITQPNIYWTMDTPLATIIGLHTNVPKYGVITPRQREWFIEELRMADKQRPGKAVILCMHHAPYSADINHGASLPMIDFLEGVFSETGIRPDIVFSGHVHNYQRFSKLYSDGLVVPFIVAGTGGFDELHPVALTDDERFTADDCRFEGVNLEYSCDSCHGFMKVALEKADGAITITGEYYTATGEGTALLADRFALIV
ncbi:calcineurin-like phosphoesterase family protein [Mucilaginibacter oryzae]|uniref:Calcineurin-like phosphoesterase family protein n=1 Tax=Mucilaginibacter oryzae TaxID=468058 RepID=A0A316HJI6_9SPHI|nr:metallophosphoesterase [Mucilaginibacter oryzae]PWK78385.1 calcineurin-like phosphoesterase family protein [Mucilaginibacter oryzae]